MTAPTVISPRDLASALDALADLSTAEGPGATLLAGGTDLMVEFRTGRTRPAAVVDLWRVEELRGIAEHEGGLRLGALTTCAELLRSPLVRARASILADAADEVGAEQIKSRATLGGNLGTASPAADLNPVLVALDAQVQLMSRAGRRVVAADEFLTGYRTTLRRPDELIESIVIPARPTGERLAFRKVCTRRAQSISKVVFAVALTLEDGVIHSVRGAAGSVAPRTQRLLQLEAQLAGQRPIEQLLRDAARDVARLDVAPIDDVRSSAAYRLLVLERALSTMLHELCGIGVPRD